MNNIMSICTNVSVIKRNSLFFKGLNFDRVLDAKQINLTTMANMAGAKDCCIPNKEKIHLSICNHVKSPNQT